jgi:hypothetical protein
MRDLDTNGRLLANKKPTDARWSEIFEAEEISRAGRLDMSKVQMTYFTLILALVYGVSIANAFGTIADTGFHAFPVMDKSMIALFSISHVGYLTGKAVPERDNI